MVRWASFLDMVAKLPAVLEAERFDPLPLSRAEAPFKLHGDGPLLQCHRALAAPHAASVTRRQLSVGRSAT